LEVIVDPKKMQTDVTLINPKGSLESNTPSWNEISQSFLL
jgi:hypothetical protein